MEDADVVVIGGGISGLSFAHRCAEVGLDALLLENSSRLGGCIHSERLTSGYWFEIGAHTCYNSYAGLIQLIESCGLSDQITARAKVPFRLLKHGELRSIARELSFWEALRSVPHASSRDQAGTDGPVVLLEADRSGELRPAFYHPCWRPSLPRTPTPFRPRCSSRSALAGRM